MQRYNEDRQFSFEWQNECIVKLKKSCFRQLKNDKSLWIIFLYPGRLSYRSLTDYSTYNNGFAILKRYVQFHLDAFITKFPAQVQRKSEQ